MSLWDCLRNKTVKSDPYKEKWKHLKQLCTLYHNMIAGNYINFAICEYYSDDVFTQLSTSIFQAVASCSISQLRAYEKVH